RNGSLYTAQWSRGEQRQPRTSVGSAAARGAGCVRAAVLRDEAKAPRKAATNNRWICRSRGSGVVMEGCADSGTAAAHCRFNANSIVAAAAARV
ncbi:hypothetical protein Dimus_037758, partial [Dionaea muscipula]